MNTSSESIAEPADEAPAKSLRELIQLQPGEFLYGVVDGAQDLELAYEAKCLHGQEIRMLFEGDAAAGLAEVAPYLVPIDLNTDYLESWESRLGKNAGILLVTKASADELFKHLREIFIVQDESGQEFFFRFYDPRVLRVYLPSCAPADLKKFSGPISTFVWTEDSPDRFFWFPSAFTD